MDPLSTLLVVAVGLSFNLDDAGRVFEVLGELVLAYREVFGNWSLCFAALASLGLVDEMAVCLNRLFAHLQLSFCCLSFCRTTKSVLLATTYRGVGDTIVLPTSTSSWPQAPSLLSSAFSRFACHHRSAPCCCCTIRWTLCPSGRLPRWIQSSMVYVPSAHALLLTVAVWQLGTAKGAMALEPN